MDLPTFSEPPPGTATALQLAETLERPWKQVKSRLARNGAPKPVGVLTTTNGAWPWLYPAELAREWLETTADGETIYDERPEGCVTVADLGRRFGMTQAAVKGRLKRPGAPRHVGRLRAPSHPRLYVVDEVRVFLGTIL